LFTERCVITHGTKPPGENFAIDRIAIADDVLRRSFPAAGFGELPGNPFGARVCRQAQPKDLAPILARKVRYYEDRRLRARILPPPSLADLVKLPKARHDDWSALPGIATLTQYRRSRRRFGLAAPNPSH
jgi:hypothetical protein